MVFVPVSTYQTSKTQPFTYHMCAYLLQITVVKCDAQTSNDVNYFKKFYVVLIMLRGQLQAFLIKYNKNTMVEIYQCLLRVFHWNILVHHQKHISIQLQYHVNVMQYFTLFISQQQTGCCYYYCTQKKIDLIAQEQKNIDNIIKYNMGKHIWFC